MSDSALLKLYHNYLVDQCCSTFIAATSRRYAVSTLSSIAVRGDLMLRRAAVLALGYLGDFSANSVMGRALDDEDRGVRLIAESGIRHIWLAAGTSTQRQQLLAAERLIGADECGEAIRLIRRVLRQRPDFAEASRLLGVAQFGQGAIKAAGVSFRQAVIVNPYQFQAAIGLANCNVRLGQPASALRWFRRALRINPELESIRMHVAQMTGSAED